MEKQETRINYGQTTSRDDTGWVTHTQLAA